MTIKITQKQYDQMLDALYRAESHALQGINSQIQFDPLTGECWLTTFQNGERYEDDAPFIEIYRMESHTLKDLYGDDDTGVDWEDENYKDSDAYYNLYDWHFDDNIDGFRVNDILDEALERHNIER